MLCGLAGVYGFHAASLWLQQHWMVGIAQDTVFSMRKKLFSRIQKLPVSYFQTRKHGEMMSRFTNDIENVSQTLNGSVIQVLTSVLTLIGTVAVMLWLSPLLTVLTLTVVPAMYAGMKWITNRTGYYFREQQKNLGNINGFIEETLTGHQIVKMFSQEERVIEEFRQKNEALRESGYWAQVYSGFIRS